jgi:hypothetical protein
VSSRAERGQNTLLGGQVEAARAATGHAHPHHVTLAALGGTRLVPRAEADASGDLTGTFATFIAFAAPPPATSTRSSRETPS